MASVIQLTQGQETRVSRTDFTFLSQWEWCAHSNGCGRFYATRNRRVLGKCEKVLMHRVVSDRAGLDLSNDIDHIDGDGLNNIRSNLRAATRSQNLYNRGKTKNNTSGIKGVSWDKGCSKWRSQIQSNGTHYHLGSFDTKEEAAEAYREAAKKVHKEFSNT